MAEQHLGVNIDHVATVRQARGTDYPDPVKAALLAESAGADSITLHLREDRRHIQDEDLERLQAAMQTHMNLEMAVTGEMLGIAAGIRPQDCCLVPEKREELTTEGGLDVAGQQDKIADACERLTANGIRVSLFIDPEPAQLDAARLVGAGVVELHTGTYADAAVGEQEAELQRIVDAAAYGQQLGLVIHAGHGLHYENVKPVARIPQILELNIGHAIVARAIFDGFTVAVSEMKRLMTEARQRERAAMIFGVGTDILELSRVQETYNRFGDHFVDRLLMEEEREQFRRNKWPVRFLAMRFAAKEATVKAMGTGFRHGIWIRDVGIVNNDWGRPEIIWSARGQGICDELGISGGHVSLSDDAGLILAFAVVMQA